MEVSFGNYKLRIEILILIVIVFWILFGHLLCSCSKITVQEGLYMIKQIRNEGFSSANSTGIPREYLKTGQPTYIQNPNSWGNTNLTQTKSNDKKEQPIPLPDGQLDMLANVDFKPECCPSAYSSSTGCACLTVDQYDYLKDRGGNNVPFSEY